MTPIKCIIKKILNIKSPTPTFRVYGCIYKYPYNKRCEKCKHYKINKIKEAFEKASEALKRVEEKWATMDFTITISEGVNENDKNKNTTSADY